MGEKKARTWFRIHVDIWEHMGCPTDINAALRRILSIGPKPVRDKIKKNRSSKPRANLKDIKPGDTVTFPRDTYRYESILQNVYRYNSSKTTMAVWADEKNTYVYRYKVKK